MPSGENEDDVKETWPPPSMSTRNPPPSGWLRNTFCVPGASRSRVLIALLPFVILLTPLPAQASSPGFITICTYTHSARDDPIVYPGRPGASHLHDFFANPSTEARSTYASMTAATSTCGTEEDTAGYWTPALYKNGSKIAPCTGRRNDGAALRCTFYYREDNISSTYKAAHPVEVFPANFRMVTGNGHAASESKNPNLGKELYYGCSDNSTGKLKAPPNCSTGTISIHVGFPNCWNGQTTGTNDTPNVAWPSSGVCPPAFPKVLPRVIMRLEYKVGNSSSGIKLSSGPVYTLHGDFWNTWEQSALSALVARCLTSPNDCGNNPNP